MPNGGRAQYARVNEFARQATYYNKCVQNVMHVRGLRLGVVAFRLVELSRRKANGGRPASGACWTPAARDERDVSHNSRVCSLGTETPLHV